MAQSPGCNLTVDEARLAENVAAVVRIYPFYVKTIETHACAFLTLII